MKQTYSAVMADIARLQAQAEILRKAETQGVIKRIREAIDDYGLQLEDLGSSSAKASKKPGATKATKATNGANGTKATQVVSKATTIGVPRYQDPKSGKTWTGRGKPPGWIAGAKDREAFSIKAQN